MRPLANRKQNSEAHDCATRTERLFTDGAKEGFPSQVSADLVDPKAEEVILVRERSWGPSAGGRRPGGSDSPKVKKRLVRQIRGCLLTTAGR